MELFRSSQAILVVVALAATSCSMTGRSSLAAVSAQAPNESPRDIAGSMKRAAPQFQGTVVTLEQSISPAGESVTISNYQGTSTFPLTGTQYNGYTFCSGTPETCVVPLDELASGKEDLSIGVYDGPNGTGKLLSVGSAMGNVRHDGNSNLKAKLSGVVASLQISLSNPTPAPGAPATSTVNVTALDGDGQAIAGDADYVDANGVARKIVVTDSDTTKATKLKDASIAKPSAVLHRCGRESDRDYRLDLRLDPGDHIFRSGQ